MRWYQRASELYRIPEGYGRVYVEFGCGRGRFVNEMAAGDPEALYIGVEGCKTTVIKAMSKTKTAGLKNLCYIDSFINDASTAFEEGSLNGVFLNFSDPWPKDRHADRRLTAPAKAAAYLRVLKPGGFATLKTDSEALFRYSLKTFTGVGFEIATSSDDDGHNGSGRLCENGTYTTSSQCLLNTPSIDGSPNLTGIHDKIAERAIATPTEYELRFRSLGQPIYHFTALKPHTS